MQVGIREELGESSPPFVDQASGAAAGVDAGEVEEVAEEDEDRDGRERGDDRQGRVDLDDVEVRAELAADDLQGLTGNDLVEERAEVRACSGRAQPVEEGDADEDRQRCHPISARRRRVRRIFDSSASRTMRPARMAIVPPNFAPQDGLPETNTAASPTTIGTANTARRWPRARSQETAMPKKMKRLTMKIAAP